MQSNSGVYCSSFICRFEDPHGTAIATHSRKVEESVRRKDTKRKDDRERRKERKEAELREKEAETKRLMNLKRAETKSQLMKISDVAGSGVRL
jgi:protein KRI1